MRRAVNADASGRLVVTRAHANIRDRLLVRRLCMAPRRLAMLRLSSGGQRPVTTMRPLLRTSRALALLAAILALAGCGGSPASPALRPTRGAAGQRGGWERVGYERARHASGAAGDRLTAAN